MAERESANWGLTVTSNMLNSVNPGFYMEQFPQKSTS